ncbi:hypothetical protein [Paenibacillus sp. MBLB4367]|uniref:hypothetical protein n=1 Tax=Paenibacillus sp. MBLB4367 TaxID=3384767 RepID=UPI003908199C
MEKHFDFSLVETYFHISPNGADQPYYEMPATAFLLDSGTVKDMLQQSGATVQATGLELPASFVGISLCNLCITQLLFTAQYNRLLDLTLGNLTFQIEMHDDHAHLGYKINELRSSEVPEAGREAFLARHWKDSFTTIITPAVQAIAAAAGVKPDMIWQQYGGQLARVRDFVLEHEKREPVLERFHQDCGVLTDLAPELFQRKRNPFQHTPRYIDSPYKLGAQLMLHSSCCMYVCRTDGQKCYTCPRMTEAEREERKARILAKAQ